jgi:hypothetical protein
LVTIVLALVSVITFYDFDLEENTNLIMQQCLDEASKVTILRSSNNGQSFNLKQFAKKH